MLIRNTLLYLPAQIIGPATQFLAILVFTHWMAPEPYGILTYVIASQDLVFFLCVNWWSQYTVRYFADHAASLDNHYRDSEGAIMAGMAVAQVAATIFALWLLSAPMTPLLATAAVLYTLTRCLSLHLSERGRAQNLILDYTLAVSLGPLLGFVVAFAVVAWVAPTPTAALFSYAAMQAITLVWLVVRQGVVFRLRWPDRDLLRQSLVFGLPLIGAGVAGWCSMNAIRVLVDHEMGAAAMGLVAVGWTLGHRLATNVTMLVTVAAFPLAVQRMRLGSRDQAVGEIARNGVLMLGIVLPAAVGLYLVQGILVPLFVAAPFRAMTLAVLPAALVAGVTRNLRTHVTDQVFFLIERTSMVCIMTMVEAALVVVACLVGLMLGGTVGAAIGSAAGFLIAMVAGFAVAQRRAGLHMSLGDSAGVVAATAMMALAVFSVGTAGNGLSTLGLQIVLGILVYSAAILMLFPALGRSALARWKQAQPLRSWKKS